MVTIRLPPLADRKEDLPLLAEHFLKEFAKSHERSVPTISTAVMRVFRGYNWPGNVREFRNVLESMLVMDQDGRLDLEDLPEELQTNQQTGEMGVHESLWASR